MDGRNVFDQLLSAGAPNRKPKRVLSLPVSIAIHVAVLLAVVVLPLLSMGDMPEPMKSSAVHAFFVEPATAPPPPPPPPAPAAAAAPKPVQAKVEQPKIERPTPVEKPEFTAPIEVPRELPRDEPLDTAGLGAPGGVVGGAEDGVPGGVEGGVAGGVEGGVPGGVEGGTPGGIVGGVIGGMPAAVPEPPKAPVRVGGQIRPPRKIRNVEPVYSALAREARADGVVILEAVIGPSGAVDQVKVLRGHPLLTDSAVAAVKQWVYSPTLLNGVPVPVIMSVTVNFRMQ